MGIHVLIVDDSRMIRQVVKKVVNQVQVEVDVFVEASDGKEALEAISRGNIDLVLSDINMPNMDGLQMLMTLRQMEAEDKHNLPVIMITTEGSEEKMGEAMQLGANGYVLKPFTPEALADQLRPLGLLSPSGGEEEETDINFSDPEAF